MWIIAVWSPQVRPRCEVGLLVTGVKFSVHLLVLTLDTQVPSIVTIVTILFCKLLNKSCLLKLTKNWLQMINPPQSVPKDSFWEKIVNNYYHLSLYCRNSYLIWTELQCLEYRYFWPWPDVDTTAPRTCTCRKLKRITCLPSPAARWARRPGPRVFRVLAPQNTAQRWKCPELWKNP